MLYCYIHKLSELPKLKKYFSFPSVVLCFPRHSGESILLVYIYFVVIVVLSEKNNSQSVIVLKEIKLN